MSGNDLIDFLCCLGTAQAIAETAATSDQEPKKEQKKEPIASPVFGTELPMLALSMDREANVRVVEDSEKI